MFCLHNPETPSQSRLSLLLFIFPPIDTPMWQMPQQADDEFFSQQSLGWPEQLASVLGGGNWSFLGHQIINYRPETLSGVIGPSQSQTRSTMSED